LGRVRGPACGARPRGRRVHGRVLDRLLHGPAPLHDLPRRVPRVGGGAAPRPRVALDDARAARRPRGARRRRGLPPGPALPRPGPRRAPAGHCRRARGDAGAARGPGARHARRRGGARARVLDVRRAARDAVDRHGAARGLLSARPRQVPRRRAVRRRRRPAALRARGLFRARLRPRGRRRGGERGRRGRRRDELALAPAPDGQRAALRALVPPRRDRPRRLVREGLMGKVLSLVVFWPTLGAALLALLPREHVAGIRRTALAFSLVPLALSLWVLARFAPVPDFQFTHRLAWIPAWGASYRVAVDGVSLFLVLLTTVLTPVVVLASWGDVHRRVKEFFVFLLVLETGMLGTFLATDLLLFYVFWEIMLVPMYFLIGVWGGPRRIYAAVKFVLFTLVGSLLML